MDSEVCDTVKEVKLLRRTTATILGGFLCRESLENHQKVSLVVWFILRECGEIFWKK